MSSAPVKHFQDTFNVITLNPDEGKKFDNVTRLQAESETYDISLTLDICSAVFPVKKEDRLELCFTNTLNRDGIFSFH